MTGERSDHWQLSDRLQGILAEHLHAGEQVRLVVHGADDSAMIATDARLYSITRGLRWGRLSDTTTVVNDLADLTAVVVQRGIFGGFFGGSFSVQGRGFLPTGATADPHGLMLLWGMFDQADEGAGALRELIEKARYVSSMR